MSKLGKEEKTNRGFAYLEFEDSHGIKCSLQTSSALIFGEADEEGNLPYTYGLWIGCNSPNPKSFTAERRWIEYPLPDHVQCTTRMHLTRDQVSGLIVSLQAWLDSDETSFGGSDE